MESKPVVEKDFEFLVCHRRGFVVLRLDSTVDQTFYFAESLGFKLLLTDTALGINTLTYDNNQHVNQVSTFDKKRVQNTSSTGTRSAIQDHSFFGSKTPVISDNGCEFYVQQRQGQIALSQDNTRNNKFYFNARLSFKLVFTDGKSSLIMPVQQIPQTHQTVKKPEKIIESLSSIPRNILTNNQRSQVQGITSTTSVKMPALSKLLTSAKSVEAFHNAPSVREQLKKTNQSEVSGASLSLTNSSCVHKMLKEATEGRILSHNSLISKQPNQSVEMQEKLSFNRVNRDPQYTDAHRTTDVASSFSSENEENKFEIDAVQEFKPELNHESTDFQATHQTLILEVEDCKPSLVDLKNEFISEQLVSINEEETSSAPLACHKSRGSSRNANISPKSLEETGSCQVQSSENEESIQSNKSFKKQWLQASRIKRENRPAGNKHLSPVTKVMRQNPRPLAQNKQTNLAALSESSKGASYSLVHKQDNQKMPEKQREKSCRSLANDERRSQAPITNKQKIQAVTISKRTRGKIMNKKSTYYTQRRRKKRHFKRKKDEDYIPESDEEEDDNDISDFEEIGYKVDSRPKEKKYVCGECGKQFSYSAKLKKHEEKFHSIPHPCDVCEEIFDTKIHLRRHKRLFHAAKYACDICDETFRNKTLLKRHNKFAHSEVFSCDVCRENFQKLRPLLNHKRLVHNINTHQKFLCEQCGKSLKNGYKHNCAAEIGSTCLKRGRKHRYFCSLCKKNLFGKRGALNQHLKVKHFNDLDRAGRNIVKPCPDCGKCFLKEIHLIMHARTHNQATNYRPICDQCGLEFASGRSLRNHNKRCHSSMTYKCEDCCRVFKTFSGLKRHMLSHTLQQSFACNVCHKRFSLAYNLNVHMRVHTKEKPFKCGFCNLAFSHKCSLGGHLKSKHIYG